jgi:hypothetical protein
MQGRRKPLLGGFGVRRDHDLLPIDPEALPPVFPVQTASRVLGIGKNQTYVQIGNGTYPVRLLKISGRYRVSRYDLLHYLGASQPASETAESGAA